jgi:ADP-ribosyl-[dinitrogen reductase] hydrolase
LDRALGCLLGGGVGDALGYTVEFLSLDRIRKRFGDAGIREPVYDEEGRLVVSDDTQMTLFSAEALVEALRRNDEPVAWAEMAHHAYLDWLETQGRSAPEHPRVSRFVDEPALNQGRAPGNTCLSALASGQRGTRERPINGSKGCGGVMRVAPVGLVPGVSQVDCFYLGCDFAASTHGHPSGYLAAGALAVMVRAICRGAGIRTAAEEALERVEAEPSFEEVAAKLRRALELAEARTDVDAAIRELGEGWVAEEALAVGVYAALVGESFADAVTIAANHDGDSDSTASIAGQICGCAQGASSLPAAWVRRLDVLDPLLMTSAGCSRGFMCWL